MNDGVSIALLFVSGHLNLDSAKEVKLNFSSGLRVVIKLLNQNFLFISQR